MKKLLIALFAVSLLFTPVGVLAQDPAPAVVEEVTPAPVPILGDPSVEEVIPAPALVDPDAPKKLPWFVFLLWPLLSTAAISVIKLLSDKLEAEAPPQLWPVLNMVLTAIIVGIQASGSPLEVIGNVVASVLAALGFTKSLDGAKGKTATINPALKKELIAKGVIPA